MPRKKLFSTSPKHHTLRGYTGEVYKTRKCHQFPLRVPKIDLKVSTSSKKRLYHDGSCVPEWLPPSQMCVPEWLPSKIWFLSQGAILVQFLVKSWKVYQIGSLALKFALVATIVWAADNSQFLICRSGAVNNCCHQCIFQILEGAILVHIWEGGSHFGTKEPFWYSFFWRKCWLWDQFLAL